MDVGDPLICPKCGRIFNNRVDRWTVAAAAPGRRPGQLWAHRTPDTRRNCAYVDAGELPSASGTPEPLPRVGRRDRAA